MTINRYFAAVLIAAAMPVAAYADDLSDAVTACVAVVRHNNKLEEADTFDAYVDSPGHVRYFGSDGARFAFEKCMSEAGHSLVGE